MRSLKCAWLAGLLAGACLFASTPASAAARLGESCDLSVLGVGSSSGFLHFDNALREALQARDADAAAALISFPLPLNLAAGGHQTLRDAAAFRLQSGMLLPVLHKAVMSQPPVELFCNMNGVMYDNGAVWVNRVGSGIGAPFLITSVNLPKGVSLPAAAAQPAQARKPELACKTDKFRIEIESMGDGKPLYRAWNLPHASPKPPAIELAGNMTREGTGMCSHRIWRFRNGNTDYIVTEPGCTDGSEPSGAKAQLEVEIAGKPRLKAWCS